MFLLSQSRFASSIAFGLASVLGVAGAWADGCGATPNCVDSGPFVTEVVAVSSSWDANHRQNYVRLNFKIRNDSQAPLMLGFRWRSAASLVDNFGNAYSIDWRFKERIIGIGIVSNEGADASFVLPPGGSRNASLVFSRFPGKGSVGNVYNADFSLEQLTPVPGNNSVRTVANHALNFGDLRPGTLLGGIDRSAGAEHAGSVVQGLGTLINALKNH